MATNLVMAVGFAAIGVALAAAGIYIGDTDDAHRRRAHRHPVDDRRAGARREDRAA